MIVEVKNINKTYKNGVKALNDLSFMVKKGEIFGLLGPNGSGKTTCINCILQLLSFESGDILLFNEKMSPSRNDIKKKIGYVPQNVAVFEELTVYENIDYFCSLYVKDKQKRKKLVEEAICFVSLEEFKKFYPKKLSGGLLRRLNLACGIAHKPELIIFDEPTVAVDPQSRNNILEGIMKLNQEGATIIYTSHYMEEIEQLCSYIIVMDKGSVIAHGTKEKLKNNIETGIVLKIECDDVNLELFSLNYILGAIFSNGILELTLEKGKSHLSEIMKILEDNQINYNNIYSQTPTLNDVFLNITGKELRDQ